MAGCGGRESGKNGEEGKPAAPVAGRSCARGM